MIPTAPVLCSHRVSGMILTRAHSVFSPTGALLISQSQVHICLPQGHHTPRGGNCETAVITNSVFPQSKPGLPEFPRVTWSPAAMLPVHVFSLTLLCYLGRCRGNRDHTNQVLHCVKWSPLSAVWSVGSRIREILDSQCNPPISSPPLSP